MRLLGTEHSSVILCQTKCSKSGKVMSKKALKQAKAKMDSVNPQNYNFNKNKQSKMRFGLGSTK